MLEEQARVTRVSGERVFFKNIQTSACGNCQQQDACGTALYARFLPSREMALKSSLNLKPGDRIVVGIEEAHLLRASFFVYLLPLLIMLLTVGLAENEGPVAAVIAFCGLTGGLYLVHRLQDGFIRYFIAPPQIVRKL